MTARPTPSTRSCSSALPSGSRSTSQRRAQDRAALIVGRNVVPCPQGSTSPSCVRRRGGQEDARSGRPRARAADLRGTDPRRRVLHGPRHRRRDAPAAPGRSRPRRGRARSRSGSTSTAIGIELSAVRPGAGPLPPPAGGIQPDSAGWPLRCGGRAAGRLRRRGRGRRATSNPAPIEMAGHFAGLEPLSYQRTKTAMRAGTAAALRSALEQRRGQPAG